MNKSRLEKIETYENSAKSIKHVKHFRGLTFVEFNNGNRYESFLNKISEIDVSDEEGNIKSSENDIEREITIQKFKTNPEQY